MKIKFRDCKFGYAARITKDPLCCHADNDDGFCLLGAEMGDCPLLDETCPYCGAKLQGGAKWKHTK